MFNVPLPVQSQLALLGTVDSIVDVGKDTVSRFSHLVHLEVNSLGMNTSYKKYYSLKNCKRKVHQPKLSWCARVAAGLFFFGEVRQIGDIGVQKVKCHFLLHRGQSFKPLADFIIGHMRCTWNQIAQKFVC